MSLSPSDHFETRTEPQMFSHIPRAKPDGQLNPAGEVGWFLQREREKRGLSLDAAGEATGIHPYHLEAIEQGDLTHLPHRLEATEMMAGYAQYLGFDAEPLIAHLLSFLPPPPVARKDFHPASPPVLASAKVLSFGRLPRIPDLKIRLADYPGGPGGIMASLVAAFLLVATGTYMIAAPSSSPLAPPQQVAVAKPVVPASNPASSDPMPTASTGSEAAEVKMTETPMPAVDPAPGIADDPDSMGSFIQEQIPAPKGIGKAVKIAVSADPTTVPSRVMLKARAPVWLRIEDASGRVVMTQMLNKGDTYNVPNREGLIALSRDGGRLSYLIDGEEKGVLGPAGQILVGEKLDVAALEAKK